MKLTLPKELTTVTKTSKILAAIVFITLPFIGFFLGVNYEQSLNLVSQQSANEPILPKRIPTPTPNQTTNWKTYTSSEGKFSLKYPEDWYFITAKENFGANYKGARIEILFSNKLDKNGKIPSGVAIDRYTAHGIIAIDGCKYASGCDIWTDEAKFYDTKSSKWQSGGGPYPSIRQVSLSQLSGKKAVLIKSQADTDAEVYKGEYAIQYNVLLGNSSKEHLTLTFSYNDRNQDNSQITKTFYQILSTFKLLP